MALLVQTDAILARRFAIIGALEFVGQLVRASEALRHSVAQTTDFEELKELGRLVHLAAEETVLQVEDEDLARLS